MVKVDRVEWITIPDQQTQVNALLNGEIDMVEIVPPDLLPLVQKDKNVKVLVVNKAGRQYDMRFNVLHKPFDNAKVREAVLYALDQKPFLEANVGNPDYYTPCKSVFPCGSPLATTKGWEDKLSGNVAKAQGAPEGGGLRRHADRAAAPDRHRRPQPARDRRQAAARGGRLQGRPAGDGLADAGRAPRQEGAAR